MSALADFVEHKVSEFRSICSKKIPRSPGSSFRRTSSSFNRDTPFMVGRAHHGACATGTSIGFKSSASVLSEAREVAVFGLFDGHGSLESAKALAHRASAVLLPRLAKTEVENASRVVVSFDEELRTLSGKDFRYHNDSLTSRIYSTTSTPDLRKSGCSASILIMDEDRLTLLQLGDTRALAVTRTGKVAARTTEHRCTTNPQEASRVAQSGALIAQGRVAGMILPTRALGDFVYKDARSVVNMPEVTALPSNNAARELPTAAPGQLIDYVFLGSHAIFDVLSESEVLSVVEATRSTPNGSSADAVAQAVCDAARSKLASLSKAKKLTLDASTLSESFGCTIVFFSLE